MGSYEDRSVALETPLWGTPEHRRQKWHLGRRNTATVAGVEPGELPFTPDSDPLPMRGIRGGPVAHGIGLPWMRFTEIQSKREGHFYERFSPGSLDLRSQNNAVVALLDHGLDPSAGRKPLGRLQVWNARDGLRYQLAFLDTPYAKDVAAAVREGLMGMSVRFRPTAVTENRNPGRSAYNERGIPERTIRAARLIELSVTAMPAYGGTSAKIAA